MTRIQEGFKCRRLRKSSAVGKNCIQFFKHHSIECQKVYHNECAFRYSWICYQHSTLHRLNYALNTVQDVVTFVNEQRRQSAQNCRLFTKFANKSFRAACKKISMCLNLVKKRVIKLFLPTLDKDNSFEFTTLAVLMSRTRQK